MLPPFLKRYWLALNRHKWPGLASVLGVVGISGVVALQPPPPAQYRSEGILQQNFPLVAFTTTGTEVQQRGQGIISEDFLLADVLLQEVSKELNRRQVTITPDQLRQNTRVKIISNDQDQVQQVLVTFSWPQADQAQTAINLLFEGMVALSRDYNRSKLRDILSALDERLPNVETELRQAEQALEAYDRLEGPAIQAAIDGSLLSSISGSEQQRRQNQIALAGINAQMQSLENQLGMTPDQAFTSSALSADPIIAQLRTQILEAETQLQLLSSDLRDSHPTIQALHNNLAAYNRLLEQRAAEVIGGGALADLPNSSQVRQDSALDPARAALANQLVALKTQWDTLQQQQQVLTQSETQLRQQYSSLPNKQLERDRLAQQVALKQALYDQIQAKRIDASAAEAETVSSLTIAKPPVTVLNVQEPQNPIAVMAVGSLLGLVVGGAVVFLLDMLDGTIRTHEDLQALLQEQDVPLLALVPQMESRTPQAKPLLYPDSPHLTTYERLRSNLQLAGSQMETSGIPRTVLVTSSQPGEGKTTTAFNLGITSARAGRRTLIIEADLTGVSQAYQLGVSPSPEAATAPLHYYAGIGAEPIQMVPRVENLYIAPCPEGQRQAAAILESSEMQQFLTDARGRFDFVILDAPSLSLRNDAILLAKTVDGLILVSRPGITQKALIDAFLEQLLDTEDLLVLGGVINAADVPVVVLPMSPPQDWADMPLMADLEDVKSPPLVGRVEF